MLDIKYQMDSYILLSLRYRSIDTMIIENLLLLHQLHLKLSSILPKAISILCVKSHNISIISRDLDSIYYLSN